MPAKQINGKDLAKKILLDLRQKIVKLNRAPGLAVILIGNDPASELYVRNKKKACEKVGLVFHQYLCAGDFFPQVTEAEILKMIDWLNHDPETDGIIVQLPIPERFDTKKIIERIDPKKDVDGFHPVNREKFMAGQPGVTSPLVLAIKAAIAATGENLAGRQAVIVANNELYSQTRKKDLADLGLKVEIITPDKNLAAKIKTADVLVSIVGKPHFIGKDLIKDGAIVIDVGTSLLPDNTWAGDVEPAAAEIAGWITPVPGGVGPLTVAFLLQNVYQAAVLIQDSRP